MARFPISAEYFLSQQRGYRAPVLPRQLTDTVAVLAFQGGSTEKFMSGVSGNEHGRLIVDLAGQRFGMLTVLAYDRRAGNGNSLWLCRCDCGVEVTRQSYNLRVNRTRDCGCSRRTKKTGKPQQARLPNFRIRSSNPALNSLYGFYRCNARRRGSGIEFTLSFDEFAPLTQQPCAYCGAAPGQVYHYGTRPHTLDILYSGIDRVDSARGYVRGNVRPCCKRCNIAKGSMSEQEFYAWLERAWQHLQAQRIQAGG